MPWAAFPSAQRLVRVSHDAPPACRPSQLQVVDELTRRLADAEAAHAAAERLARLEHERLLAECEELRVWFDEEHAQFEAWRKEMESVVATAEQAGAALAAQRAECERVSTVLYAERRRATACEQGEVCVG